MAEPDAPAQKRPRLDSGNPVQYNGHPHAFPPPPLPHHTQPARPPSHPTLAQTSSSSPPPPHPSRHYPPHALPPPPLSQPYTPRTQGSFPGALPSPSLGATDIRTLADPRTIPSPGQHPSHGVATVPVTVPQDRISSYRQQQQQQPPTPQSATAPDVQNSRSSSFSSEQKPPSSSGPMENQHTYWASNPEHRNGASNGVSNGYSHTISPPHSAAQQPYQPPPPATQPYAQPPPPPQYAAQPAYAPSPYMGNYAGEAQVRRKQVRATQACNHCRSRKQKCDEARPCQFCRENNFDCQYKDVPPPKQDRSMMQLQDSVNNISDVLKEFMGEMSTRLQNVESRLANSRNVETNGNHASPEAAFTAASAEQSRWPTPTQQRSQPQRTNSMKMESPMPPPPQHMSPMGAQASTPIKQESSFSSQQVGAQGEDGRNYVNGSNGSAEYVSKEKSGLQSDHTTPAHKLLEEWHTMRSFYTNIDYLNKLVENGQNVSAYPMQLELDRGLLRVWGVGEGQDIQDGAQAPGSPNSSNESDVPSPSAGTEGLWGFPPADHASPSTMSVSTPQDLTGNEGGLGSDGRPIFHSSVVWDLLGSYMKYMHVLHPFMNAGKLRKMVRAFIDQYSPDIRVSTARSPATGALQHPYGQGVKRKRSGSNGYSSRGTIERSLRNAIVLLVLALGKAFQFEAKTLPNPERDRNVNGSWGPVGNVSQSFTSDASEDNRQRNIDKLPGMAYFAYATDILGNQQGGNTIAHAHAMILAALYLSQFARVLESWSWINNACRITLVLIKGDMKSLDRDWYMHHREQLPAKEQYRLNQIMLVYWTCLQLESDILAEMSTLPPSGISAYQGEIMYPNGVSETFPIEEGSGFLDDRQDSTRRGDEDDKSMMIYSSQIWLRVILNEAHNALYGSGGHGSIDTTNIRDVARVANIHLEILESWRRMLPAQLKWADDERPATDLNVARLRAKYYGGLYMMLRPYLRIASHNIGLPPEGARSNSQGYPNRNPSPAGYNSSRNVQVVDLSQGQQDIINIACQGIDSAIRSTVAFDRVGADPDTPYNNYQSTRTKRLVVTNIFGTLHAQFGNMLVLTSVFASKLQPLLPKDTKLTKSTLAALLERTITILGEVAPNSPILAMDLQILKDVRRKHEHLLA